MNLSEKNSEIEELQIALDNRDKNIADLEEEIRILEDKTSDLEAEISSLEAEIDQLEKESLDVDDYCNSLYDCICDPNKTFDDVVYIMREMTGIYYHDSRELKNLGKI